MSIQRILVPIDGSHPALKAVETAAELARPLGASLTLLTVLEPPEMARAYVRSEAMEEIRRALWATSEVMLEKAAARIQDRKLKVKKQIVVGTPTNTIVATADAGYDLIVMASRGLGMHPSDRHLLGSVTEGVLRRTKRPVLVLPQHAQEPPTHELEGRMRKVETVVG
jgi:nucleotide-binding universal stress UspA family protein